MCGLVVIGFFAVLVIVVFLAIRYGGFDGGI
jgi:preprotein translocase subunit SecE